MLVDCGIPEGFTLGPLFLIYTKYFHKAIKYCNAKRITLLMIQVKNINKLVNHDMKHFNNWLSANKISLNVEKTELVISKISEETTSG